MSIIVFQHSDSCLPCRLGAALRDHGQRLEIIRPDRGEAPPADLENADAVISLGGPQVLDIPADWMDGEMAYLRLAHEGLRPVVGVCLGAQLLAAALGGTVEKMEKPEVGMHPLDLAFGGTIDSILAGLGWQTKMFHFHTRQITELPDGAMQLASSALCRNQAFSIGSIAYGFQFHFEADRETMTRWARENPEHLKAAGISSDAYEEQCTEQYGAFEQVADRICANLCTYLLPTEKRRTA